MSTQVLEQSISADQYFALPGLSQSGMKDLAVSPLRFWYLHVNPNRPGGKSTPATDIGKALHCAVLEHREFDNRYGRQCDPADYPRALFTMEDLRGWLKSNGHKPAGTTKDALIQQVRSLNTGVQIYQLIEDRCYEENAGKHLFKTEDFYRIAGAARALRDEPRVNELLNEGEPEVCMTAKDPETGVTLKAMMDWVAPRHTVDLKTFTQMRGKSIDKSIADAIYYEAYYRQAYFYTYIRSLQPDAPKAKPDFILAFVESDEPHEVRLRSLGSGGRGGDTRIYWERARIETRNFIRQFADHWERFGDKPWRSAMEVEPLQDEDISQLAWS